MKFHSENKAVLFFFSKTAATSRRGEGRANKNAIKGPAEASAGKIFLRPGLGSGEEKHVRVSAKPIGRGRSPHLTS